MTPDDKPCQKQVACLIIGISVALTSVSLIAFHIYSSCMERLALRKCEVMTPVERKAALIKNLIALETGNAKLSNRFASRGVYRVGIAHNFSESGAKDIVVASYENNLSFESNFSITRLDVNESDVETKWNDRDALVSYSTNKNTTANFIPFSGLIEVFGVEQTSQGVGRFVRDREKYHAKHHVFNIKNISVVRDCCNDHGSGAGPFNGRGKRKFGAYRQTMALFSPEFNGRDLYINTSPCGGPSTEDGDNNMGTRRLDTFEITKREEFSK